MKDWSGEFTSIYYAKFIWPFVGGNITVELPDDIKKTFDAQATMKYTGWYRANQLSHMIIRYNPEIGGQIGFTGSGETTEQRIQFVITTKKMEGDQICVYTPAQIPLIKGVGQCSVYNPDKIESD